MVPGTRFDFFISLHFPVTWWSGQAFFFPVLVLPVVRVINIMK